MAATSLRVLACLALGLVIDQAALGATAPTNDLRLNATVVTSLPFSQEMDTTGATADADDAQAQAVCPFSPKPSDGYFVGSSVWYSYTATNDTPLVVDTYGTGYGTLVLIVVGSIDNPTHWSCSLNTGLGGLVLEQNVPNGAHATIYIASVSRSPVVGMGGTLDVTVAGTPPPANDRLTVAKSIPSLPYHDQIITYGATSDSDDAQVDTCGISTANSVWYRFTAGLNDTRTFIYSTPSNYYHFDFAVATGSPGHLSTVACDYDFVDFATTPGATYYVMVSAGGQFGQNGGKLDLNVVHTPPPPALSVDFSNRGYVDRFGVAQVSGTYQCSNVLPGGFVVANAIANQKEGRALAIAPVNLDFTCDGGRRAFQSTADGVSWSGVPFKPGILSLNYSPLICDVRDCVFSTSKSTNIVLLPKPQLKLPRL